MTARRDPETTLSMWLAEQAQPLPTETKRAIAVGLRSTAQRRHRWWHAVRPELDPRWPQAAALGIAGVAIVVGAVAFSGRLGLSPGPGAGPGSSQPSPSAAPDASTWTAFVSQRYAFEVRHPGTWVAIPSVAAYGLPEPADLAGTQDRLAATATSQDAFSGRSMELAEGETPDAWLARYCGADPACVPAEWASATVDGRDARVRDRGDLVDAFVFDDDRAFVFSGEGVVARERALFDAFLSTVRILPERSDEGAQP